MEKQYHIEYPSLMKGKRVMYVHGFASSAQSGTVTLLRQLMPNAEIIAYDIPLDPQEAIAFLKAKCEEQKPDLIIGSSAGGMMSEQLYGFDRILVNPAFQMGDTMGKHGMTGKQTYQNPRKDGVQEFIVTKALVKQFAELTEQCFACASDAKEQKRVWGLFGDNDPLVHTYDLFLDHYQQAVRFHGEHRLTDKVAMHYLVPVIRWIDDCQEGRQRPVVFITIDAMRAPQGHIRPSMHKAFELFLNDYEVYFLCPALSTDKEALIQDHDWIEDAISAPSFNHVVYANNSSLLYGDYKISTSDDPNFMGTNIRLGSDEFKTWDEIITFFQRLGGQ
ncbi:MAG: esterase [Prevotella sp.]|nr:esterase [Prevotella sp.]